MINTRPTGPNVRGPAFLHREERTSGCGVPTNPSCNGSRGAYSVMSVKQNVHQRISRARSAPQFLQTRGAVT